MKKYRYDASKADWTDTDAEWQQLEDYIRGHFKNSTITSMHMYFSATPQEFRRMLGAQRIGTTAFAVVLSHETCEPVEAY